MDITKAPPTPTLQTVTDEGATTTHDVEVGSAKATTSLEAGTSVEAGTTVTAGTDVVAGDNVQLTGGGQITSTAAGVIQILPDTTGYTKIGDSAGAPTYMAEVNDNLQVCNALETGGNLYAGGSAEIYGYLKPQSYTIFPTGQLIGLWGSASYTRLYPDSARGYLALLLKDSHPSLSFLIADADNWNKDHAPPNWNVPSSHHYSTTDPESDGGVHEERDGIAWNRHEIGGGYGSFWARRTIPEEVTIPVGQGLAGVNTSGNLAPANSRIQQVFTRVTQAPGGGATTLDVGRTNGGNLDEYADGTGVALNTTTIADDDGDGNTPMPHWNSPADTLTLTTDANVTGTDMKVRIVVCYEQYTGLQA